MLRALFSLPWLLNNAVTVSQHSAAASSGILSHRFLHAGTLVSVRHFFALTTRLARPHERWPDRTDPVQ
ncbi:hypothetical protein EV128_110133 [Rhizobium azibense]|nr:hypothetical protein EV128_110133 [Rhizobium azibense]